MDVRLVKRRLIPLEIAVKLLKSPVDMKKSYPKITALICVGVILAGVSVSGMARKGGETYVRSVRAGIWRIRKERGGGWRIGRCNAKCRGGETRWRMKNEHERGGGASWREESMRTGAGSLYRGEKLGAACSARREKGNEVAGSPGTRDEAGFRPGHTLHGMKPRRGSKKLGEGGNEGAGGCGIPVSSVRIQSSSGTFGTRGAVVVDGGWMRKECRGEVDE
ncbi:hypothetical protein C8J57DRAFT_1601447 [Mycena rebaudengoi]|nr:hypothetical protein C8J57DRAFT_1601447 [Mycena rebaudengoi]